MAVVSRLFSMGLYGMDAFIVEVEADISVGLPGFDVVGLPDASVKESRDRVRSAMKNCGFEFPIHKITVNLAPADKRKEGPIYDLPLLVTLIRASNQLCAEVDDSVFIGADNTDSMLQRFDLSSLPTGSVHRATLSIYEWQRGHQHNLVFSRIRSARDWVENQATWNIWKTSNNWTTAGALSSASDYLTTNEKTVANQNGDWVQFEIVDWVQDIVDGTVPNQGWKITSATANSYDSFYTSEHSSEPWLLPNLWIWMVGRGVYRDQSGSGNSAVLMGDPNMSAETALSY